MTHDTTLASSFGYVEIPLGFIDLPEDPSVALAGVALEVWARRVSAVSGSPHLFMDFTRHLPATPGKDVLTRISVPPSGSETLLGKDLVTPLTDPAGGTAADIDGDILRLTETTDNAGVPPTAGAVHPTGRHTYLFDIVNISGLSATVVVRFRNNTTDTNVQAVTASFAAGERKVVEVSGDISDGSLYQAQVDDQTQKFDVQTVVHRFTPYLVQNEQMRADPLRVELEKLETDGDFLATLRSGGGPVPFWVPSGLAAIFAVPLDAPRIGYTEPESVKARTLTLSGKGTPRHYV